MGEVVRRLDEPIAVVTATPAGAPVAFTWRDRSYVVREVLDHWRERRAWWRLALEATARSPTAEPTTVPSAERTRTGAEAGAARPGAWSTDDLEEGVWRVTASPGRALTTGVYDLGCSGAWRLIRIVD